MRGSISQRDLPTVLLIDDDMVSREVAATVLTLGGFTVFTADDGESALEQIANGACEPAVVLMDAQMPGLSGAELIGELRALCQARVIAISGSEAPEEVRYAADGFLLKPFDAAGVLSALEGPPERAAADNCQNGDPVVSPETLSQLRNLMPEEGIREIYTTVAADLRKRMTELEWAIRGGDGEAVRRIGHAIKGGCAMAGALQAARLGATLESLPQGPLGNQLDNIAKLLRQLQDATRNLERMLVSELPA